jgi:hypothetical protein
LVVGRSGQAGATDKGLLHLWSRARSTVWLRARSTSKVGITPYRSEVSWTGSEVVVKVGTNAQIITLTAARMERAVGRSGSSTMEIWAIIRTRRLPIYGLHPILELGRRSELPLSNQSPNNRNPSNAGSYHDDNSHGGVLRRGGGGGLRGGSIGGPRCRSVDDSFIISGLRTSQSVGESIRGRRRGSSRRRSRGRGRRRLG